MKKQLKKWLAILLTVLEIALALVSSHTGNQTEVQVTVNGDNNTVVVNVVSPSDK